MIILFVLVTLLKYLFWRIQQSCVRDYFTIFSTVNKHFLPTDTNSYPIKISLNLMCFLFDGRLLDRVPILTLQPLSNPVTLRKRHTKSRMRHGSFSRWHMRYRSRACVRITLCPTNAVTHCAIVARWLVEIRTQESKR